MGGVNQSCFAHARQGDVDIMIYDLGYMESVKKCEYFGVRGGEL